MDDPGLIVFFSDDSVTTIDKTIGNVVANRWRPLTNSVYLLATIAFGKSYFGWWLLSMVLLGALAASAALLFSWLSKRIWLGFALGLLVVTSRFSQYQAIQATGLVESVGNILVVALLACLLGYIQSRRPVLLTLSAVTFLLLVLTHERYQGLVVAILAVLVFYGGSRKSRLLWGFAFVSPIVLTTIVKMQIFHIPLAVGPGSSQDLGFSWLTARESTILALADVFGVNLGPSNLAGLSFAGQSVAIQGMSLLVGLLTVLLVVAPPLNNLGITSTSRNASVVARHLVVASALVLGILLPIIVISRLEQRFVASLSIIVLAGISYFARPDALQTKSGKWLRNLVLITFVVASLFMNVKYRQNIDSVFFRAQQIGTEQTLSVLIPAFQDAAQFGTAIYLIYPATDPGWDYALNLLMEANTDLTPRTITVVMAAGDIPLQDKNAAVLGFTASGSLERVK
ncbi:MAG: hypothetical protein ACYCZY_10065 [Lacisediminihabitans sp.]